MSAGAQVRVLARSPPGKGEHISGVEYLTGSITDYDAVNQATKGVDGIFHLAGIVIHSR
jgi:nucleoside-diphosphate-sugar epimerase